MGDNESIDPARHELECIGSFHAKTPEGEQHTIEIWTKFHSVHDRDISRIEPGLLVLTTTHGHGVERIAQGQYKLKDGPEVYVSTDDPHAP